MSITDELREWTRTHTVNCSDNRIALVAIAERIDKELAERYVALPLDADGVPIHVGDKMEFCAFDIEHPVIRTVDGIGKDVFFAWCGERGYQQHDAKRYRHYTPPTVEDVLREFADEVRRCCDTADTIAEYAAKLRLAEREDS